MPAIGPLKRGFVLQLFALTYCAITIALPVLWMLLPLPPWWLALIRDVLAPWLFLPLPLLVVAAVLERARQLVLPLASVAVTFVLLFSPALLPPFLHTRESPSLRVVTYNHLYLNNNPAAVIATIRAQHADIVALQELTSEVANMAQQTLLQEYPYQLLDPDTGANGLGILSRLPFEKTDRLPEIRAQQVIVRVGATPVTFLNVHPTTPFVYNSTPGLAGLIEQFETYHTGPREQQLDDILTYIDSSNDPLILLGDFNTSDRDPMYTEFSRRMTDAYRTSAWGFGATFPNHASLGPLPVPPLVRIDYVWSRGLKPQNAVVHCNSGGSDHCLLVADLAAPQTDTQARSVQ